LTPAYKSRARRCNTNPLVQTGDQSSPVTCANASDVRPHPLVCPCCPKSCRSPGIQLHLCGTTRLRIRPHGAYHFAIRTERDGYATYTHCEEGKGIEIPDQPNINPLPLFMLFWTRHSCSCKLLITNHLPDTSTIVSHTAEQVVTRKTKSMHAQRFRKLQGSLSRLPFCNTKTSRFDISIFCLMSG
jgi:hypothetical protein